MEKIKLRPIADLVLHNDHQVIVLNKPNGLATMSDKEGEKSLLSLAEIYAKQKLFPVHRIDQPTSGIVLFAKNKKSLAKLNADLQDGKMKKKYWAWVKGAPPAQGELIDFLWRDGKLKKAKVVEKSHSKAKEAKLTFTLMQSTVHYALLEVKLITGRFHQIRAQFSNQGWPIQGDEKYGAKRGNPDRSIALHARSLTFMHPTKGNKLTIHAPPPSGPLWDTL